MKQPREYATGEDYARAYWQEKLARVECDISEYDARKPFARAKDNQAQKNRRGEATCYRQLLAQLDCFPAERDPIAAYDIRSRVSYWASQQTT